MSENIKENIAKNLVALRKKNKWTQQQLAVKLNYSDKAISRWEHAETLPDIETLCKICDIYGVRFEYLLQDEQPEKNNPYVVKRGMPGSIIVMFILLMSVWIAVTVAYMCINIIFDVSFWTLFIWGVPISCVVCLLCNKRFFANRVFCCVINSILTWSLLLAIYLELMKYNIWMLFIIGVPIQAVIVLTTVLKYKNPSYSFLKERGGANE